LLDEKEEAIMNIEEILNDMEDLLMHSKPIPFATHRAVIDADRMRDLLGSAQRSIPAEIKRAKLIDSDCDRIIEEARAKAEAIIQDAESRAQRMLSEEVILQEAKKRALDMLTKAQNGSNDIKEAAEKYVQHLLDDAQIYFQNGLQEVQQTKNKIEDIKK
jgi:vacuolar-type H+-ATPase subunit H